jgi:hypothetical protein
LRFFQSGLRIRLQACAALTDTKERMGTQRSQWRRDCRATLRARFASFRTALRSYPLGQLWLATLVMLACASVGCMGIHDEPGREIARKSSAIKLIRNSSSVALASSSVTVAFGATATAGNLLLAFASHPSTDASYNTPTGWTVAAATFNNSLGQIVLYKYASGSETGLTVDGFANSAHTLQVFEFSGIDPNIAPVIATRTGQTQGTYEFPTVTTTATGSLVVSAGVSTGTMVLVPNFSGWTNGFFELNDATIVALNAVVSAYGFVGAAGSWNTSATTSALGTMLSHTIAFQRRPTIVTDLAVSASANKNVVMFTPPSALVTDIVMLARTGDCNFTTANPTGAEALGASVGDGTVILNQSPTADLSTTSVTVGSTSTTVSYDSATNALTHSSLVAGTLYCYKVYARNGSSLDDADPARPTRSGTPTAGGASNPVFVFNSGSTSLSAPSVLPGVGAFYADNSGKLISVDRAGLRRFKPYSLPNAVQNRAPTGTLTADSQATTFVTSLSGDAYAIWASGPQQGTLRWSTEAIDGDSVTGGDDPLGASLYASPLVSNTLGRVFVPTRNALLYQNRVYALNAATGACLWVFNGTCAGASTSLNVGQISSGGVLDPTNSRLIFTSISVYLGATLWAVDVRDGIAGDRRLWSRNIGDSDSSVTFATSARSSILVGTNAGRVYRLNPTNGATCWASISDGCPAAAVGVEQFFCADGTGSRTTICLSGSPVQKGIAMLAGTFANSVLFRTADGAVWRVSTAGARLWRSLLSGASTPTPVAELNNGVAYVGGNDGVIREISLATGSVNGTRSVGGGAIVVGDATYDVTDGVLYVNTSQGYLYAFSVPF